MSDHLKRQDAKAALEVTQGFIFKEQIIHDKRMINTAQNNMFLPDQDLQIPPIELPESILTERDFDAD